jgi:hypothetical protein
MLARTSFMFGINCNLPSWPFAFSGSFPYIFAMDEDEEEEEETPAPKKKNNKDAKKNEKKNVIHVWHQLQLTQLAICFQWIFSFCLCLALIGLVDPE